MMTKKEEEDNKQEKTGEQKKIGELTDTLQRLQAEFENYKKRVARENSELVKCSSERIIKKLLPVLDSFEQLLKAEKTDEKGAELIYAQLISALEEEGLRKINCEGKEFDPYTQEILLQEESEKDNIVLEEMQKGYTLNGNVIRTAKVKIGKRGEDKMNKNINEKQAKSSVAGAQPPSFEKDDSKENQKETYEAGGKLDL